ncbi:uncharacterized protein B0J16DRAFT_382018 [Fusarium flagelliforme]|uniref:uncharacterized protein n=1 Tax=Fusarium flagelliforme TaxID=2675880 RepID=UPI001E8E41EA|nr:uncharacterized protein B0J16DRAFT_382018 [Fusarium flagelliforme]KAH7188136.1 hypothetical protein B0J16DRAFT_382018 [Fusarium flagelliforme]
MSPPTIAEPSFGSNIIEDKRSDGYWVETFHFDKEDPVPGIITSGLVSGEIEFIDNPIAVHAASEKAGTNGYHNPEVTQPWTKHLIGKFDSPVAVVACDITKNGLMDLIICHTYGPFMLKCDMAGGWVSWLENPGRDKLGDGKWKERKIGRWPAMHRMKAGYFTQKSFLEVVAASVVRGEADKVTPIPIIRFQAPENVLEATEWPRSIIDDENFTVIHEVTQKKFDGPDGLDSMIISSREGTTWLHYEDNVWKRDIIGIGEPKEPRQLPNSLSPGSGDHWGTGCADVGKFGDDPFAYVATLDPFHGISACVYTKTNRGLQNVEWKRHVLDTYGTPNQRLKRGDGPGHYIVCADFDGDGNDEFLLALFGPLDRDDKDESIPPPQGPHPLKGIMYYKPIDLEKGIFAKWRIADESSARIAIGNFAGAGKLDLVSIGYNVKQYYQEPKPVTTLHLNKTVYASEAPTQAPIVPTAWDNEGLVYLARPHEVQQSQKLPLIEVANYAISVELHPKNGKIALQKEQGIKVLYGSIHNGDDIRKPLGNSGFPAITPVTSKDCTFNAGDNGAIVLRLVPTGEDGEWAKTEDVPVKTTFKLNKLGLGLEDLKFKKVEDLWFGGAFKGKDFWNMTGFHFRFADDKTEIAHMQFWTAGTNVDCGVHNHSGDIFEEIHICLSPGTGNGGMSRLKDGKTKPTSEKDFDHVALPRLYEHGGMWYRDSYGNAVRNKENAVSYPYHKWQAGSGPNLDVWMALEFNPDIAL